MISSYLKASSNLSSFFVQTKPDILFLVLTYYKAKRIYFTK